MDLQCPQPMSGRDPSERERVRLDRVGPNGPHDDDGVILEWSECVPQRPRRHGVEPLQIVDRDDDGAAARETADPVEHDSTGHEGIAKSERLGIEVGLVEEDRPGRTPDSGISSSAGRVVRTRSRSSRARETAYRHRVDFPIPVLRAGSARGRPASTQQRTHRCVRVRNADRSPKRTRSAPHHRTEVDIPGTDPGGAMSSSSTPTKHYGARWHPREGDAHRR